MGLASMRFFMAISTHSFPLDRKKELIGPKLFFISARSFKYKIPLSSYLMGVS